MKCSRFAFGLISIGTMVFGALQFNKKSEIRRDKNQKIYAVFSSLYYKTVAKEYLAIFSV